MGMVYSQQTTFYCSVRSPQGLLIVIVWGAPEIKVSLIKLKPFQVPRTVSIVQFLSDPASWSCQTRSIVKKPALVGTRQSFHLRPESKIKGLKVYSWRWPEYPSRPLRFSPNHHPLNIFCLILMSKVFSLVLFAENSSHIQLAVAEKRGWPWRLYVNGRSSSFGERCPPTLQHFHFTVPKILFQSRNFVVSNLQIHYF